MNNDCAKRKNMKSIKSIIYVLLAGTMWGCMGLLVRPLNNMGLQTMDIVAIRSFVTVILTLIGLPLLCKLNNVSAKQAVKIDPKDIWVFIGTGIVSVVFFNFCYFNTIIYTSLSVAAIMLYTAPIFVMLISVPVFKEKLGTRKIIALVLAFVGCGVVTGAFTGNMVLDAKGLLFGLGAGGGYALYSIFGKIAADKGYSSANITLYTFIFASIGVLPFINIKHMVEAFSGNGGFLYSIVLIIITTFLPYIFYTAGLSMMEPGKAAIVACIEPVVATYVGWIAFAEKPTLITYVGVIMVIAAIVLINANNKKV